MQGYASRRHLKTAAAAAICTGLYACTPAADPAGPDRLPDRVGVFAGPESERFVSTYVDARPAALIHGRVVEWGELRPLLGEAAGADVLQEVILDRALKPVLADAGLIITQDDVDAERALFYRTLSPDPDVAVRLGRTVRAREGYGPRRFDRLLRRNAALRALVRDGVEVTEEAVRRAHDILYGPRRQARIMVLPTLVDAERARQRVEAGEFFGEVAVEVSTDSSAARGGLLEPFSRADPSYPQALRDALWAMEEPGELSPPVVVDEGYAVLMLVRTVDAEDVELEDVRPELERQARLTQERILMDRLARRLLAETAVQIIDESLRESWEMRSRRTAVAQP